MADATRLLIDFGTALRRARGAKGLSQEELAARAGFDRTYVSLVERGKRNLSLVNLCRFARAVGRSPSQMLRGIGGGAQ